MANKEEKKDLTGLDTLASAEVNPETARKDAEYDLTTALLQAAEFRNSDDAITEIEIKRNRKRVFTFHVRPISDSDARRARKKATTYMPNPNGRKLPPIEKEFNSALFNSLLIYTATTKEDQNKIWKNQALMEKYDILDPVDTVDILLAVGEKLEVVDTIMDISGMAGDDGNSTPEDYAKN